MFPLGGQYNRYIFGIIDKSRSLTGEQTEHVHSSCTAQHSTAPVQLFLVTHFYEERERDWQRRTQSDKKRGISWNVSFPASWQTQQFLKFLCAKQIDGDYNGDLLLVWQQLSQKTNNNLPNVRRIFRQFLLEAKKEMYKSS